jgi:tellurite resistance protein
MVQHPLNPDARDLEEAFFADENRRLLEKLRERAEREQRRAALRLVLRVEDDALADTLLDLGIGPETALALTLLPLLAVAWADGKIEPREREAVLRAAEQEGIEKGTPARELLESWLGSPPSAHILGLWKRYVRVLWQKLGEPERRALRERMSGTARQVAEASGGLLGLTSRISAAERAVLEDLEHTLA